MMELRAEGTCVSVLCRRRIRVSVTRVSRPVFDMANALAKHVALLGRYIEAARGGDDAYRGEIAGKVRLLAVDKRTQMPLLRRVAELTGDELTLTLGGPDGWEFMGGAKAGDVVALADWMSSFGIGVETSEGPVQLTNAQFMSTWAEQYGAAHEDRGLLEAFHVSLDSGDMMRGMAAQVASSAPPRMADVFHALAQGPSLTVMKFIEIAVVVHKLSCNYLDALTKEGSRKLRLNSTVAASKVGLERCPLRKVWPIEALIALAIALGSQVSLTRS